MKPLEAESHGNGGGCRTFRLLQARSCALCQRVWAEMHPTQYAMTMRLRISCFLFAATLLSIMGVGCKSAAPTAGKPAAVDTASLPAPAAAPPADAGMIQGTISFKGRAPERVRIDMAADPACAMGAENDAEQIVASKGRLANVYIYIKAGATPSQAPANTPPVVMDQKGCRYTPHVIALQQGGTVEFRNSDPTTHNVHTMPGMPGNKGFDVSQMPMGQAQVRRFGQAETMIPLRCNNHPWMNAFVNVADTPFFAVSGADGSFSISGLPPGDYTLAAMHDKLGEQTLPISVSAKGTTKVNFNFAGD
jgi:plastocyanin